MNLTPREKDKLLVAMAAMVARKRLERGVKLNYPEAVALISDFVVEGARDGVSVADLMQGGAGPEGRPELAEPVSQDFRVPAQPAHDQNAVHHGCAATQAGVSLSQALARQGQTFRGIVRGIDGGGASDRSAEAEAPSRATSRARR